jgi:putative redox protein
VATQEVVLRWAGELRFEGGRTDGPAVVLDSAGAAGPSPVTALVLGLGGCMAVDVVDIVGKMRVPLRGLELRVEAERREEPPRRVVAMRLRFILDGPAAEDEAKVWRAIDLSREKYCSVWHTLREDIDYSIELQLR